jgi:hypothetical protein
MFETRVLKEMLIFGLMRDEIIINCKVKSKLHSTLMRQKMNAYMILVGKLERKEPLDIDGSGFWRNRIV